MGDSLKQKLLKPIQLADQLTKLANESHSYVSECLELKSKTERLSELLRQAARADLYERPAHRIIDYTQKHLEEALKLVTKCRSKGLMKLKFTIISTTSFPNMFADLDNSIGDLSWLLRVSAAGDDDGDMHLGLPPIARNKPILVLIWAHIAALHTGSLDARADAAASLVSLAGDNERCGKLIIEEDGVGPLLRLVKEGRLEGQRNAARAIGLLGRDAESVDQLVVAGVCSVFSTVLKKSPMKVQAMVAWAVSELADKNPNCQDVFFQNDVLRFLIGHLAFETEKEHPKYRISNAQFTSMHNVVQSSSTHSAAASIGSRESEDPATKAERKAMAARALWKLAEGNSAICKRITETKALRCFAILLANGEKEVQFNSAMALMEISLVAEANAELRRSAFTARVARSTACVVVDQLVRIVEKADYDRILVPCITALGCLSRTFRASERRIIGPLVQLLDEKEGEEVVREAAIALTKFACADNYLHLDHCKAIINAGGAKHLVQLVYFGEQAVKNAALILMSNIALHVPENEELARAEVLKVLEWASKQGSLIRDYEVDAILSEAKSRLELYQCRG